MASDIFQQPGATSVKHQTCPPVDYCPQLNAGVIEGGPLNLSVSCSCQKCELDSDAPRNGTGGPSQGDLQHALIN